MYGAKEVSLERASLYNDGTAATYRFAVTGSHTALTRAGTFNAWRYNSSLQEPGQSITVNGSHAPDVGSLLTGQTTQVSAMRTITLFLDLTSVILQ